MHGVSLRDRVLILIDITWVEKLSVDLVIRVPRINYYSDEGGLFNDQLDDFLGGVRHQEGVLPFKTFIADREMLGHL